MAAETSWQSLGELFVERGLISEADLERAHAEQSATNMRLADILVRRGLVTGHDITAALVDQMKWFGGTAERVPLRPVQSDEFAQESSPPDPFAAQVTHLSPDLDASDEPAHVQSELETAIEYDPGAAIEAAPQLEAEDDSAVPLIPVAEAAASVHESAQTSPETLIREAEARQHLAESRLASIDEICDGLERIQADLEMQELATPPLVRELGATQERVRARKVQLVEEITALQHVRAEVERQSGLLDELRTELTARIHELSELQATAAVWNARVADLEAEVASLTQRADAVVHELSALAESPVPAPAMEAVTEVHLDGVGPSSRDELDVASESPSHLLFVPTDEGYELLERDGPPPVVGEGLAMGENMWIVTKVGPSPLPFDERSCVFFSAG